MYALKKHEGGKEERRLKEGTETSGTIRVEFKKTS